MGEMERAKGFEIFRTRQPIPFKIITVRVLVLENQLVTEVVV
jgi:hypothetical protein